MVTKKKTAPAVRTRTVYRARKRAAPRRKSGIPMIPSAMATAALAAVNYGAAKTAYDYITSASTLTKGVQNFALGQGAGAKKIRGNFISKEALVKDAIAIGGGYLAGEIVKKYAPAVVKRPLGKIAKKIPKVI